MTPQLVVETLTCGRCGRLIGVDVPRLRQPGDVERFDQELGRALIGGLICPVHGAEVILHRTSFVDVPLGASGARGTFDDGWRAAEVAVAEQRWWGRRAHDVLEQARVAGTNGDPAR